MRTQDAPVGRTVRLCAQASGSRSSERRTIERRWNFSIGLRFSFYLKSTVVWKDWSNDNVQVHERLAERFFTSL
jgi:hypothetical protein